MHILVLFRFIPSLSFCFAILNVMYLKDTSCNLWLLFRDIKLISYIFYTCLEISLNSLVQLVCILYWIFYIKDHIIFEYQQLFLPFLCWKSYSFLLPLLRPPEQRLKQWWQTFLLLFLTLKGILLILIHVILLWIFWYILLINLGSLPSIP